MQCIAVQCGTVKFSAVQCINAVQYSTLQKLHIKKEWSLSEVTRIADIPEGDKAALH